MSADTTHLLADVDMRLVASLGILTNPVPIDGPTRANLRAAIQRAIASLRAAQDAIGIPRRRVGDPLMGEVVLPPIEPAPELSFDRFERRSPQLVGVHATSPAALARQPLRTMPGECSCTNGECTGIRLRTERCKAKTLEGAEHFTGATR